ncbi:MAG: transcription-repair coupling factor [Alphaproteobacteria bacterium]|nr:transcription-repair coupling factor [Alphaproteobacteria bacterium]
MLDLAQGSGRPVLAIVRDAERLAETVAVLEYFTAGIEILSFPAWDCLPYDRVSPAAAVSAQRMETLSRLAGRVSTPIVVVTTVNAAVQRVPTRDVVASASFRVTAGGRLDVEAFLAFLARDGYARTGTVREPGEFAVRGGVIDVFPPGAEEPVRLDLFGDAIEGIRAFDPLTQISLRRIDELPLIPVSEVFLDRSSIERFRAGYRERFGAVTDSDPLYFAISGGSKYAGMEHWVPLFHDTMGTLFDYLPGAIVSLDPFVEEAAVARFETIAEHYQARAQAGRFKGDSEAVYKPLPPEALYLKREEWRQRIDGRSVAAFGPTASGRRVQAVEAGGKPGRSFAAERQQTDSNLMTALNAYVAACRQSGQSVVVAAYTKGARDRIATLLKTEGGLEGANADHWRDVAALTKQQLALAILPIEHGFSLENLVVVSEQDLFGDRLIRRARRTRRAEAFLTEVSSLAVGDFVVHIEHGIGRYDGLKTLDVSGAPHDCVALTYAGDDRLYIPVENIDVLSRYGSAEAEVVLDRLGGGGWQARKARLKERLREIAGELIKVAAARAAKAAPRLDPPTGLYDEFCARFPFELTEDQQGAINDVLGDLATGRSMDRLVCGDVGFGKTEVALRATFATAMAGRQVAVVVPTTLLARQHFETIERRFAGFPIRVAQLSRLVPAKQAAIVREELAAGKIDVVVGTHALLAKNVAFRDLALVVVDEEQHFGVVHKERLKQLRNDVHVLTMTATPIPRTLQMALSGIRELSLIATPPVDRLAVRTFIMPHDPVVLREAVMRERFRGGQTFYVCPRIRDLREAEEFFKQHVPEVKYTIAHGQLAPRDLEDVMQGFYERRFDALISTNIIESGLDVPSANTMIIHRADMFGLAQLYQLRGRIGRSKVRAYAYLTILPGTIPTAQAQKRLEVMQTLDQLGAGFSLASHDLDIRGAGNLLGEEQSGHIREVGLELYQEMLEEAINAAKAGGEGKSEQDHWSPQLNFGTSVLIPEAYVGDLGVRMGLYRRLGDLTIQAEIDGFAAELVDRFGPMPDEVKHLLEIVTVKGLCRQAGVERFEAGPRGASVVFRANRFSNPAGLVDFISRQAGSAKLRPDHTLVLRRHWDDVETRLREGSDLVKRLAEIAAQAPTAAAPPRASAVMRSKT